MSFIPEKPTLDDYRKQIQTTECRWCNYDELHLLPIQMYDHKDGWAVRGELKSKWLFIECPVCQHQWSLIKLGVKRGRG